jgi:hypothetical protein
MNQPNSPKGIITLPVTGELLLLTLKNQRQVSPCWSGSVSLEKTKAAVLEQRPRGARDDQMVIRI